MGFSQKLQQVFKQKQKDLFLPQEEVRHTLHQNLPFTAREQYKLLRTNLTFTLPEDVKCPVIGVTSSMRGEGKSTTALNLSYVLAENGKKVLLIDCDLRIPSIAKKLEIKSTPGITDYLINYKNIDVETFKSPLLENWYVMPSGDLPPNPSELLGSAKMERRLKYLSQEFDYIILDLPPVNLVSDALAISKYLSGLIVVIRQEYTQKKEVESCFRQLRLANVRVLGCVINDATSGSGYYNKYKYRKYYKYYKYYSHYGHYGKHRKK